MKTLFDVFKIMSDKSLESQLPILEMLNEVLGDLTQDLKEFNFKHEEAGLFEILLIQTILHNASIITLSKGSTIRVRSTSHELKDLTGVYSIARLQIETFYVISSLFFTKESDDTNLKAVVYKIHGLRKQLHLNNHHPKTFEPVHRIRKELAAELFKLRRIKEYQESLNKQKFEKPQFAKLEKPESILRKVRVGNLISSHSLYSNHIHSEYIGIRQFNSTYKTKSQNMDDSISTVVEQCSRLTAAIICHVNRMARIEGGTISNLAKDKKLIIDILVQANQKI